jgi:hypothetical protein
MYRQKKNSGTGVMGGYVYGAHVWEGFDGIACMGLIEIPNALFALACEIPCFFKYDRMCFFFLPPTIIEL